MDKKDLLYQFINCSILRDHKLINDHLWVRNGKIINPEPIMYDEKRPADFRINCNGAIISPGFIDIQINGGYGYDFAHDKDRIMQAINCVGKGILAHGVTSYCPTVVTSDAPSYRQILNTVKRSQGGPNGASVLGLHLEGPFISPRKKGAHIPDLIKPLTGVKDIDDVYGTDLSQVSIITLAPEMDAQCDVVKYLVNKGVTVAIGHSAATLVEGENAINAGATLVTHLFNAMLPFHHRDPGLVGLLTSKKLHGAHSSVYYGIIGDGVHTHPAALRIAFRSNNRGLILVTDAMSAMGLETGRHYLGENEVEIAEGRACIVGTNTLCGSIATMDHCVRNLIRATDCSIIEALECATLHPAEAIGITDQKGTLRFGSDADFVLLDSQSFRIQSTWIAGQCVYKNAPFTMSPVK